MSKRSLQRAQSRRAESERRRLARRAGRAVAGAGAMLGASALLAPGAHAANLAVTNLADSGAGSLRDALATANLDAAQDTITFASSLSGQITLGGELPVLAATTIVGPGAGQVTINGGGGTRLFAVDTDAMGAEGDIAAFSGLTFTGGHASGSANTSASDGGAIHAGRGSRLEVSDSVFVDNHADHYGGAINVELGGLTLTGSTLRDNSATLYGGALSINETHLPVTVTSSTISGNSALWGGGVSVYDPHGPAGTTFDRTTISGNTSTRNGGGIWVEDTHEGAAVTVLSSTVSGNTAGDGGGGVSFGETVGGPSAVINSTISGNTAAFGGGLQFADAARLDPAYPALTDDGSFALRGSTVSGNHATDSGGGVWRGYPQSDSTMLRLDAPVTVQSTVVSGNDAQNAAPDLGASAGVGGALTLGNSLIQNTSGSVFTQSPDGTNLLGVDPVLSALGDHGGPTQTLVPASTSPLLDAGVGSGQATDQRGLSRSVDLAGKANGPGSDGTDIGAVELPASAGPPVPPSPPATPGPAPATSRVVTPIADGTPTVCSDLRIALRPVSTKGGVALTGVTLSRYAGLEAKLFAGTRQVGTAGVQADGTFAAIVPRPKKGESTSYSAVVADAKSLGYKLATGLAAFTVNGTKLSARITGPKATRPRQVSLYVQNSCSKRKRVGIMTVAANGTVKTTIRRPTKGFAVYRISTQIKGNAKGFLAPSLLVLR